MNKLVLISRKCGPSYNTVIKRILVVTILLLILNLLQDSPVLPEILRWNMAKSFDELPKSKILQYLGSHLLAEYRVRSNFVGSHEIILTNTGYIPITAAKPKEDWSIYFNHIHVPESHILTHDRTATVADGDFILSHVDGGLFKLTPTENFKGILPKENIVVSFQSQYIASHCYVLPRWYVIISGMPPLIIENTNIGNSYSVTEFDQEEQWKTSSNDNSNPLTLSQRFQKYSTTDFGSSPVKVIPTPKVFDVNEGNTVNLKSGKWVVCNNLKHFEKEIKLFSEIFKIKLLPAPEPCPPSKVVEFIQHFKTKDEGTSEEYEIVVDAVQSKIVITAGKAAGAFYAIQTLRSLAELKDGKLQYILPACHIQDAPRFSYRGLHIDVARNFIPLKDILHIIETMSLYKLNKLHLHLTDDEGWRIEIEGLPELTEIGSVRRHTETEEDAIFPALGSGPDNNNSGTGYYTIDDYKKILKAAAANHIEVIPEVDTPGHSHAAIRSMHVRYKRFMEKNDKKKALEFLLHDFNDKSRAISVQHYRNNAMNPCMTSTHRFIDHIVGVFKKMHRDIQPLKTIHMGGDEVAGMSWGLSPICEKFLLNTQDFPFEREDLQDYFMKQTAETVGLKHELSMGVWEEGALKSQTDIPIEKRFMLNTNIIAYAWKKSSGDVAYRLANAGYKVVVAHAAHLYFDHPQEPDPEEVGLNWATRYIDDRKVFNFRPGNLDGNGDLDYSVGAITLEKPDNIIGIQAELWTELVRNTSIAHHQLFPRLIALAERAWHKADWETQTGHFSVEKQQKDWTEFANVVGYKEIPRLRNRGIQYRIPPPGVKLSKKGLLKICSLYPGFQYKYRQEGGKSSWSKCQDGDILPTSKSPYEFATYDGGRYSRVVKMGTKVDEY